jgi:uncharacterized membrane protein
MPLPYKIILSIIVLLLGSIVAFAEFSGDQPYLGWVVVAITAVMVLGQWVFPEAGGGKPDK